MFIILETRSTYLSGLFQNSIVGYINMIFPVCSQYISHSHKTSMFALVLLDLCSITIMMSIYIHMVPPQDLPFKQVQSYLQSFSSHFELIDVRCINCINLPWVRQKKQCCLAKNTWSPCFVPEHLRPKEPMSPPRSMPRATWAGFLVVNLSQTGHRYFLGSFGEFRCHEW